MNTSQEIMPKNSTKIWKLGVHRLMLGDSTLKEDVDLLLGKDKVSLLLTDPPYGVGYVENKEEFLEAINGKSNPQKFSAIKGDDLKEDYYDFSKKWLEVIKPYLAGKNSFYIFNGDTKLREFLNSIHDLGYTKSAILIWIKNHAVIGRKDYHPQHELIIYGWLGKHEFFGNKDKTALFYPKPNKNKLHPTMKPPMLLRRLIYHGTKPGDIVLDPFGGSGSTLIACEELGRKCLMVEYDEKYCKTIIERWQKLTGKKAELINHA